MDTHEKLYDFLAKEYPHAPKMIAKPMFLKIIKMMAEQEEINRKFAWDLEHYIECQFAIHHDSYVSALMILIQQTFDFGDSYSYWLYEDCKSYDVNGVTVDISTPSKLYNEIAKEFKACGGQRPAPKSIDSNAKILTEQELFEMMKKTVMNNPKLLR